MRLRTLAAAVALTLVASLPLQAQQAPPIRVDDTSAPLAAAGPDAAQFAQFDALVAAVQQEFQVPGVAVAIVKDGKVVLERGYGLREIGKLRVSRQELARLVGCSREMAGRVLKKLQADGKLHARGKTVVVYGTR